jgi:hypothetical protein
MAVLCLPIVWVCYNLNWIHQRREFLNLPPMRGWPPTDQTDPPWPLKLFGEVGCWQLTTSESRVDLAHALFPEAKIHIGTKMVQAPGVPGQPPWPKPIDFSSRATAR